MTAIEWEVHLEAAGDGSVDEERLVDLLEHLSDFGASVTGSPEEPIDGKGRYGATFAVAADSPVQAVVTSCETFMSAAKKAGLPDWPIVRVEVMTEEEFETALEQPSVPDLVGITEISEILGVSRQRASELARSKRFPSPLAELASGPVWAAPTISRFVDDWERRPGRPRKAPAPPAEDHTDEVDRYSGRVREQYRPALDELADL